MLTVVMYHYVRPLRRHRGPAPKGLDLDTFRAQLDHLRSRYVFASIEDVLRARRARRFPWFRENRVLLTFDDGYRDHFDHVLPVLRRRGIPAAFFPVASASLDGRLLDANRVHFVLAAGASPDALAARILQAVREEREALHLHSDERYLAEYQVANRWDPPTVNFVKRMLQHALPESLRLRLAKEMFAEHVSNDETSFARGLYMGVEELRQLVRGGMHVGLHGDRHVWLDRLSPQEAGSDIDAGMRLRVALGNQGPLTFCYPFGGYNATTVALLRQRGFELAFTVRPSVVSASDDPLALPRLDTNDLPPIARAVDQVHAAAGARAGRSMSASPLNT